MVVIQSFTIQIPAAVDQIRHRHCQDTLQMRQHDAVVSCDYVIFLMFAGRRLGESEARSLSIGTTELGLSPTD